MKKYYVLEGKRNKRPEMVRLNDGRFAVKVETDELLTKEPVEVKKKREQKEALVAKIEAKKVKGK